MEYRGRTNNSERTGHQEAPYGYDSVWTVALMLNSSIQWMKDEGFTVFYCFIGGKRAGVD